MVSRLRNQECASRVGAVARSEAATSFGGWRLCSAQTPGLGHPPLRGLGGKRQKWRLVRCCCGSQPPMCHFVCLECSSGRGPTSAPPIGVSGAGISPIVAVIALLGRCAGAMNRSAVAAVRLLAAALLWTHDLRDKASGCVPTRTSLFHWPRRLFLCSSLG